MRFTYPKIIALLFTVVSKFLLHPSQLTQVCMSNELSVAKKIVEEVLIDLMTERVMSECRMSTGV